MLLHRSRPNLAIRDVLFNNAGIAVVGELEEISEADWASAIRRQCEEHLPRLTGDNPV